jgi:hypothetical protein
VGLPDKQRAALRVDHPELRPSVTIIASISACALCELHATEQATDFFESFQLSCVNKDPQTTNSSVRVLPTTSLANQVNTAKVGVFYE